MLTKTKWIFSIIIAAGVFLSSCNSNDSFYNGYSREDLYRLPLIKPYELLNMDWGDDNNINTHAWTLKLLYNNFYGYVDQLNVSDIQVSKGIIYGHGQDGLTPLPNYWFAVIPDQKFEQVFKKRDEWVAFLKQKQIDTGNLYKVWPVFNKYKEDASLPWHHNK